MRKRALVDTRHARSMQPGPTVRYNSLVHWSGTLVWYPGLAPGLVPWSGTLVWHPGLVPRSGTLVWYTDNCPVGNATRAERNCRGAPRAEAIAFHGHRS